MTLQIPCHLVQNVVIRNLIKIADFKNEFSWSKSRNELFNECKRKYFLTIMDLGMVGTIMKKIEQKESIIQKN